MRWKLLLCKADANERSARRKPCVDIVFFQRKIALHPVGTLSPVAHLPPQNAQRVKSKLCIINTHLSEKALGVVKASGRRPKSTVDDRWNIFVLSLTPYGHTYFLPLEFSLLLSVGFLAVVVTRIPSSQFQLFEKICPAVLSRVILNATSALIMIIIIINTFYLYSALLNTQTLYMS